MIPEFDLGNVLPPFMHNDAVGGRAPRSPYRATMADFVVRFATTPERSMILRGLMAFRAALRDVGFEQGFQWIDGSFVEACEVIKGRPPQDVDIVSVLHRPIAHLDGQAWDDFLEQHWEMLFDSEYCKATYFCDAYFVDLDVSPQIVSEQSAYWFGIFSHQRVTFRWKGLVQLDLQSDDDLAMQLLAEIEARW